MECVLRRYGLYRSASGRKFYIDQILEHDIRYTYLYQIRPGVTSYATLYNGYTDTMEKMLRRLEYDLYYLGHRSWWLDFKILANTFCSIVFGKKVLIGGEDMIVRNLKSFFFCCLEFATVQTVEC